MGKIKSDGSTASYYELPPGADELQDLISFKDMNGQIAEIFRACFRYGQVEHSEKMRDAKKMLFYAKAEIERLEKYESGYNEHQITPRDHTSDSLFIGYTGGD